MPDLDPHETHYVDQMSALVNELSSDLFETILLRNVALWEYDEAGETMMNDTLREILDVALTNPQVMAYMILAGFRTAVESTCLYLDMTPAELQHEVHEHDPDVVRRIKETFDEMRFQERIPRCGSNAHTPSGLGWPGV